MDLLAALFGIGTLISVGAAMLADEPDRSDAAFFALVGVLAWAASNFSYIIADALAVADAGPLVERCNSLIDVATLAATLWRFGFAPHGWRAAYLGSVAAMLAVDIYREMVHPNFTIWAVFLNALFAAQLVIVAYPGGRNARHVWRRVRSLRGVAR